MRVAIVHDWLIAGGAERVVLELHRMYPDAPIYTSYYTPEWRKRLDNKVVTGFLQRWPFPKIRKFVPFLRILWFSRLDLRGYDLIISSTGAEAKGIRTPNGSTHISYIHAPTHYYWSRYDEYMRNPGFGGFDWLARIGLKLLIKPLRNWDYQAAQKPDYLIANSTHTQRAISTYYDRKSTVIHPPIDTSRFANAHSDARKGFVITGRHTPYKRFDLAVQACTELNLPLTVLGNGPDTARLKKLAGPSITFAGFVSDEEVVDHIASAEAFLFPGVDDFGIAPVEAMATGTPVIAFKAGGALDYITPPTGLLFEEQTVASLCDALTRFKDQKYTSEDIKAVASNFSAEHFRKNITKTVGEVL